MRHIVHFTGPINYITVNNIRDAILKSILQNATSITMIFSSEGGDLNSGLSLYHFLRALPVPLTMHNFGSVESIAVLAYLAADTRLVVEDGRFLIHSFSANFPFTSVDLPRLSERTVSINSYAEIYAKIFNERTKNAQISIDIHKALHGEALIVDASAAVSHGIATTIAPAEGTIRSSDAHRWVAP